MKMGRRFSFILRRETTIVSGPIWRGLGGSNLLLPGNNLGPRITFPSESIERSVFWLPSTARRRPEKRTPRPALHRPWNIFFEVNPATLLVVVGTFGAREPVEASRFDCLFDGFEIDGPHPSAEPEEAEAEAGGGASPSFLFAAKRK